jgi:hypothetical protein
MQPTPFFLLFSFPFILFFSFSLLSSRGVKNYLETGTGKPGTEDLIPVLKNKKLGIMVLIPGIYREPVKLYIYILFFSLCLV